MRFINTTTLKFEEVSDLDLGRLPNGYSILSHRWTWGDGEITYPDILASDSTVKAKEGYPKFEGACILARKLGYKLLWIDTCCINKTDSVELGEAINSMYRWYALSKFCIAYLEDVTALHQLSHSVWFDRGWTLQELIAPETVSFYNRSWECLGNKTTLSKAIVAKTGIPSDILSHKKPLHAFSIAQRMSWAAKRTTKRLEDRAYSLMGLFGVNMPMIYGEREQAFTRLQKEIISKSTDESVFVWDLSILEDSTRETKGVHCGLFATSPACFANCSDVDSTGRSRGFRINQFGLSISSPATLQTLGTFQVPLQVTKGKTTSEQCALILAQVPGADLYARTSSSNGESFVMTKTFASRSKDFSVPMETTESVPKLYHGLWLRKLGFHDRHIDRYHVLKRRDGGSDGRLLLPDGELGTVGIVRLSLKENGEPAGDAWIRLGFDSSCFPVCSLTFPATANTDSETDALAPLADDLLGLQPQQPTSTARLTHEIFNDSWTHASSQYIASLPSHCYDSRLESSNPAHGFSFEFQAPQFKIKVVAERVSDISPAGGRKGETWAVDIVAGEPPVYHSQSSDSCCC